MGLPTSSNILAHVHIKLMGKLSSSKHDAPLLIISNFGVINVIKLFLLEKVIEINIINLIFLSILLLLLNNNI